jgi:hypothetical protein
MVQVDVMTKCMLGPYLSSVAVARVRLQLRNKLWISFGMSSSDPSKDHESVHVSATYTPSWVQPPDAHTEQPHDRRQPARRSPQQSEQKEQSSRSNEESDHGGSAAKRGSPTDTLRFVRDPLDMMDLDGINENVEESAVLQDIENNNRTRSKSISELHEFHDQRKETHTPSKEVKSRPASTRDGTSDLTWRARMRKNSSVSDTTDYAKFETAEVQKRKGFNKKLHKIRKVFRFLFPDLGRRINIYIAVLFLLTVSYTANSFSYTYGIFRLYGCTLALELICSVIDRCVYKLIDVVFITHFNIAYQLHAINGPLGFFLTILIIGNFWQIFRARSLVDNWDTMVTVAAVFIICLAAKNWLSRRQYIYLLEQRFTDKVESLNTTIIILSELASTRPPKTSRLERVRMGSTATCSTDATALTNASKLSTLTDNVAVQGVVKGGKVVLTEGKMLAAKVQRAY